MRKLTCIGLLIFTTGCGLRTAPVSGRVTLDNKPLVNAMVIFFPDSDDKNPGPGSQGKTNENGEYSLKLNAGNANGAMIGKHKVSITGYEGDDGSIASSGPDMAFRKLIVPAEYNSESKLTFEVPSGGSTSANFDLKSAPK